MIKNWKVSALFTYKEIILYWKKVQMLSYDEAFHYQEMDAGAIYGEHGILLIKTGAGGSIRGRGDKYNGPMDLDNP